MKKTKVFVAGLLVTGLLFGCQSADAVGDKEGEVTGAGSEVIDKQREKIDHLTEANDELKSQVKALEMELDFTKEEVGIYSGIARKMVNDANVKELSQLAEMLWEYKLLVNDQPIPKNGKVKVDEENVSLSIVQQQPSVSILPNGMLSEGKISGEYFDHIVDMNAEPDNTYGSDGTLVTGMHYDFTHVEKEFPLKITITEELKERLGMTTTSIVVSIPE
ncbi:hypothetical protein [Halobacillus yeomjeoni]|uniref:Lipoprotein n=1 Tax=Halobacillus yeomjeoni TaxID=311194 RepID=A0A931HUQ0_9BACI|nr:hypothetical protein [Halobacillus yeomjeoni]MBH0229773.1 hypothetical protein [Halobacillus yeomjeoni]